MASEKPGVHEGTPMYWGASGSRGSRRSSLNMSRSLRDVGTNIRDMSASMRSNWGLMGMSDNPLERSSASRHDNAMDDEEALKWAALQKLPTYDRVRTSVFHKGTGNVQQIDVRDLSPLDKAELIDNLLKETENENNMILTKMRKRLDK